MPSLAHELFLTLFRNRPELAAELLREALGLSLPRYTEARLDSVELSQAVPTSYTADLVVLLVEARLENRACFSNTLVTSFRRHRRRRVGGRLSRIHFG